MTKLLAEIRDFRLIKNGEWCAFRIGEVDDFHRMLDTFKSSISFKDRDWDPRKRIWHVRMTDQTERQLRKLFDNFGPSPDAARSQMELFT